MNLLIILLSIILVVNTALLMLLILIQLPKKEAGAGVAFGGGATDALFGAGSGNALTKMTKYTATIFLGLVLTLSFLSQKSATAGSRRLASELQKRANAPAPMPSPIPAGTNKESGGSNSTRQVNPPSITNQATLKLEPPSTTNKPTTAAPTTTNAATPAEAKPSK